MSKLFDLKWNGEEVVQLCEEQLRAIMNEAGLVAEGEAKRELRKGHGVVTGTLRRSIHTAQPDYNFAADDVKAAAGTPERGGKAIDAVKDGSNRFAVAVGSGLRYAMKVHQGWGNFQGYHYITNGVDKMKKRLGEIIARHQV